MEQNEKGIGKQIPPNKYQHWKNGFDQNVQEAIDEGSFIKDHDLFIKHILDNLKSQEVALRLLGLEVSHKSSTTSNELRTEGNYFYFSADRKPKSHHLDRAFEEYTKSIAFAPPKTRELSLAYASRSAVFYKAKLFSDCLLDIDRALEYNCPDNQKAKLYLRKVSCLQVLKGGNHSEITESFAQAEKWLGKLDTEEREVLSEKLEKQKHANPIDKTEFPKWNYEQFVPSLKSKNSKLPGFSNDVKLKFCQEFGRHIVAAKNIKPGKTLAVQAPYVKSHFRPMRWRFCCQCGQQMWASVPCDDCTIVMYCSEVCREKRQSEYHEMECPVIQFMANYGMKEGLFIIARLVTKALKDMGGSVETLMSSLQKIDTETDPLKKRGLRGVWDPTKFSSVYTLSVHPVENHLKASFYANSIIIAYLFATKTKFFGEKMNSNLNHMKEDRRFIFLIGLVQKIMKINNTNNISTTIVSAKNKPEGLFHGIFSTVSFFNHSCNPSIVSSVQGDKIIITSIHPIKKGEQIFFNYGQHYKVMAREKRQEELKAKFHFNCKCRACIDDWPMTFDKPSPFNLRSHGIRYEKIMRMLHIVSEKLLMAILYVESFGQERNSIPDISSHISDAAKLIKKSHSYFGENSTEFLYAAVTLEWFFRAWNSPNVKLD